MMGERKVQQDALFYEFSLERHLPEKHLLRAELGSLREQAGVQVSAETRGSIIEAHRRNSSLLTHCWSKADSNHRSPSRGFAVIFGDEKGLDHDCPQRTGFVDPPR
jgi:hypothetical protein